MVRWCWMSVGVGLVTMCQSVLRFSCLVLVSMPTSWAASRAAGSASSSACRVRASMSSHEIDKGLVLPVLKEIGDLGGGQFGEFRDRGDEGHGGVCHRCQNVVRRHTGADLVTD